MKLDNERSARLRRARTNEALTVVETEESPMADFEQLFTVAVRDGLEKNFLVGLEAFEAGKPNTREFIQGELAGLLVLDQALKVPLVLQAVRQRALRILSVDVEDYINKHLIYAFSPVKFDTLEQLSEIRRIFFGLETSITRLKEVVTISIDELAYQASVYQYGRRLDKWTIAGFLFHSLILYPDTQPAIKRAAWANGFDEEWKEESVAQDRLLPKALHRLLEPSVSLTPTARENWIRDELQRRQSRPVQETSFFSISKRYSMLAILLAPEPQVMLNGQIDLGMPKKNLAKRPELPVRPQM